MRKISTDRIFEFELAALKLLQENNNRLPSREIVRILENTLELNQYEPSTD